jgi:hypothetical protein
MVVSSSPKNQSLDNASPMANTPVIKKGTTRGLLKIVPVILLTVGVSSIVRAQPIANAPELKLGSISLGISLEDAQSASPTADWRVEERLPSGKPSRYVADNALEWSGDKANVTLASTYYSRQILLSSMAKETNAQSCLERAKNWSVKLAETSGVLVNDRPEDRLYEEILLGRSGVARLFAAHNFSYWPTQKWSRRPPTDFYFSAKTEFVLSSNYVSEAILEARYSPDGCAVELTMRQRVAQPPDIQELPNALQRIVRKPSIGQRHFLSSSLKNWIPPLFEGNVQNKDRSPRDILSEAITAQVRCLINRHDGVVRHCELATGEPSYPSGVVNALTTLGASHQFDTSGLGFDIDDPAPLQVTLPVTLSPNDIVLTQFQLPDAPLQIPFKLPEDYFYRAFPQEAIDKGLSADMLVLCQIQIDQSVVCKIVSFAETNPKKLAVLQSIFTPSVLKVVHQAKVCPDGCTVAPPAGAVFKIDLKFMLSY